MEDRYKFIWNKNMEFQKKKMQSQLSQNQIYPERSKRSSYKRPFKPQPTQISLTQSLFPSKKNSLRTIHPINSQSSSHFYQTLDYGFAGQWTRPQSKRASRKQCARPQTSKGSRALGQEGMQRIWKISGVSKSMHQQFGEEIEGVEARNSEVQIVLNRRGRPQKQKSFYGEKFKTELSDDFLCLFAD